MNSETTSTVWSALLDADLNSRYWRLMALRHTRREKYAKIFLAVTASATVASWAVWEHVRPLWQGLSVVSAVVSVALPILDVPKDVKKMAEAQAEWTQLMHEYAELWEQRAALADADFSSKLKALRAREVKVSSETATLPSDDTGLAERCYAEVLKTRGLRA
jgi:hypothetical protein